MSTTAITVYVKSQVSNLFSIMRMKDMYPYKNGLCINYKLFDGSIKQSVEHSSLQEFVWCYITKPRYASEVYKQFKLELISFINELIASKITPPQKKSTVPVTLMSCETVTTNFKDRFERPFIVDQTTGERDYDFPDVDKEIAGDGIIYRNERSELGYLVQIVTTDDLCNSTGTIDTTSQTNKQSRGVYNFQKCTPKQTAFITITDFDAKLASFLEELNLTKYINGMWLCAQYNRPDCIPTFYIDDVSQVRIKASDEQSFRYRLDGIIKLYVDTFETYEEYPHKESTMIHIKRYYKEQNCVKYKCSMFVDPESKINTVFASFHCVEESFGYLDPRLNRLDTNNTFEDEYITNGSIIIYSKDCKSDADFEGLTKLMQKI